jgi:hypothetical protein
MRIGKLASETGVNVRVAFADRYRETKGPYDLAKSEKKQNTLVEHFGWQGTIFDLTPGKKASSVRAFDSIDSRKGIPAFISSAPLVQLGVQR